MPHLVFQKFVEDLETAVSAWENNELRGWNGPPESRAWELDFYRSLRNALDTYYAEVARR